MAQWRKTFFSLGGPEFIADPRADEAARIAQVALQSRAQRMAEEAQLRQLAEEQRQFDQQALFRRDELARRAEEFGWQQQQAERGFAAEQQDRLFARNRATGADAFAREQAAAQQAEAARRLGLARRRLALCSRLRGGRQPHTRPACAHGRGAVCARPAPGDLDL